MEWSVRVHAGQTSPCILARMNEEFPQISGYTVEAQLGSGGMATVYRARQLTLDRLVAIKVLRGIGRDAEELAQRFEQEAKLIAALDHPNIVQIFEVMRTTAGEPCYVMPLLAHGDLADRPKPMGELEIKRVLAALLAALGHAHRAGVVHRDVKPENVLFDARNTPLLADFGVALKQESRRRLTSFGRTVGSSQTMSPEQARGDTVDGRSDLYSVGCVAFELLTGAPPFDGDEFLAVALKHQQDPVPRLPPSLKHWQDFIDTALAKRPEDRFVDADAMAHALESVGNQRSARPKSNRAPLRKWLPAAFALLAVVAIAWWFTRTPDAATAADVPQAQTPDAIAEAIAAGRWFNGDPNDADALLAVAFATEPVAASALDQRDQLLARVAPNLTAADDATLAQRLPHLAAFVAAAKAEQTPPVRDLVAALETRLTPPLQAARDARDRKLAGVALDLAKAVPAPSEAFAQLRDLVARFPASGEPFADGDGPPLLLIPGGRISGFAQPFAVTQFEIRRQDFARFVAATQHTPARCRDGGKTYDWRDPGFAQQANEPLVCVSYNDALAYAAWMTRQSGRTYRLPSLAEWRAIDAAARNSTCANLQGENAACNDRYRATAAAGTFAANEGMPQDLAGNVREWTSTCEFKEIGAVRRTIANFGRLLQGKERDKTGRVCVGRYVAGSGWRDANLDRGASSEDDDSAAVDRGFRLIREIR